MEALEDLAAAEERLHASPLLFLVRAQVYLGLGDMAAVLDAAQQAYDLDRTMLPVYLVLGQAHLWAGDAQQAGSLLETYTRYEEQDAVAWADLGRARYELGGQEQSALVALDRALELDDELFAAYLYRGLTYLDLRDGQKAVNDLFRARSLEPGSFAANLGMGRALLLAGRPADAVRQLTSSLNLAEDERQMAEVHFWRAQAREALDQATAVEDWQALLNLSSESIPPAWISRARARLAVLEPQPSPTHTTPLPTIPAARVSPGASQAQTGTPAPDAAASPGFPSLKP
jgi:tetratricopeptide (TPR) repeat protein